MKARCSLSELTARQRGMRVVSPVIAAAGSDEVDFAVPGSLSSVSERGASSAPDAGSPPGTTLQSPALGLPEESANDQRPPPETPGSVTPNPAMVLHFDAVAGDVRRSRCIPRLHESDCPLAQERGDAAMHECLELLAMVPPRKHAARARARLLTDDGRSRGRRNRSGACSRSRSVTASRSTVYCCPPRPRPPRPALSFRQHSCALARIHTRTPMHGAGARSFGRRRRRSVIDSKVAAPRAGGAPGRCGVGARGAAAAADGQCAHITRRKRWIKDLFF